MLSTRRYWRLKKRNVFESCTQGTRTDRIKVHGMWNAHCFVLARMHCEDSDPEKWFVHFHHHKKSSSNFMHNVYNINLVVYVTFISTLYYSQRIASSRSVLRLISQFYCPPVHDICAFSPFYFQHFLQPIAIDIVDEAIGLMGRDTPFLFGTRR